MPTDLKGLSSVYALTTELRVAGNQTASGNTTKNNDPEAAQLQVQQNFNKILNSMLADMSDTGSSDDYLWNSLLAGSQSTTAESSSAKETDPQLALLEIKQKTDLLISDFLDALFSTDEEEKEKENPWLSLLSDQLTTTA